MEEEIQIINENARKEKLKNFFAKNSKYLIFSIAAVIIAGKEYGTGSSRDWAAKGTRLLGVRAVIAESFERIHRSNLIGMGVLPLEFMNNENRINLNIEGEELISIYGLSDLKQGIVLNCEINSKEIKNIKLKCRIDTNKELDYYKAGGILNYVLNEIIAEAA